MSDYDSPQLRIVETGHYVATNPIRDESTPPWPDGQPRAKTFAMPESFPLPASEQLAFQRDRAERLVVRNAQMRVAMVQVVEAIRQARYVDAIAICEKWIDPGVGATLDAGGPTKQPEAE